MEVIVQGKKYNIEKFECNNQDNFPFYINITNACNANCEFCSNGTKNNYKKLDLEELKKILDEISPNIRRISISGGEPLIDLEEIDKLLELVNMYGIKTTMNTNGTNLLKAQDILNKYENLYSIHLSRHHYEDDKNNEIFKTKVIPFEDLKKLELKPKFFINCLLIEGYIDSKEKVVDFLNKVSELNIKRVGFVSMMQVNKFAEENFVDFNDFNFEGDSNFVNAINLKDHDICTCHNYLFFAKNGKVINVFFRYTKKFGNNRRSLFYDCEGLKEGY